MSPSIATGVSHTGSSRASRELVSNGSSAASSGGVQRHSIVPLDVGTARRADTRDAGRHVAVLIVDGDAPSREEIAAAVTYSGIEVATAGSTAEALRLATGTDPVLVVSEMHLPDSTGIDLAHRLWEQIGRAHV